MVRTCAFVEGCRKQPCYGAENDTVASYCNEHKAKGHLDLRYNLNPSQLTPTWTSHFPTTCFYFGSNMLLHPHLDLILNN